LVDDASDGTDWNNTGELQMCMQIYGRLCPEATIYGLPTFINDVRMRGGRLVFR
jgi:hypothetical protein